MDTTTGSNLVTGGLLLSAGIGLLYSLKSVPSLIWKKIQTRFIYKVTIYDYDELYTVLENWLYKNHANKYRDTEVGFNILEKIECLEPPIHKEGISGKQVILQYKQGTDVFVIEYEGKKLLFSKSKEKLENASTIKQLFSHYFTIRGFRARRQIESLLGKITEDYNKSLLDNKLLFYAFYYGTWSLINKRVVKNLDSIVLNKQLKLDIRTDLTEFTSRKLWYESSNIPYKRTYLFYGPPGTGKTTLAFALASQLRKNVYTVNLNSINSDEGLISAMRNIPDGSLLLMEDIDAAFVGRKGQNDTKLSFSCLLNCLDGALTKEGIVTIITTNHIDKLDPALIRAGRVDMMKEIGNGENEQVEEYLKIFYGVDFYIGDEKVSIPMALVQEKCIQNMNNPDEAIKQILNYDKINNSGSVPSLNFAEQVG